MDVKKSKQQYQILTSDSNQINTQIHLPFETENFKKIWNIWKKDRSERRVKKYTTLGEQAALKQLQDDSENNEAVAINMIKNSIANGYQGIFAGNTKRKKHNTSQEFDKSKLLDHLKQTRNT